MDPDISTESFVARRSLWTQLPAWAGRAGWAVAGAAFGLAAVALAGAGTYDIGPAQVQVDALPVWEGKTVIDLPPLGTVEARTHRIPVQMTVTVRRVALTGIERYVSAGVSNAEILEEARRAVNKAGPRAGLRVFLIGLAGGAILGAGIRRGWRQVIIASVAGATVPLALLAGTLLTYNLAAFREPKLTGSLSIAPQILGPIEEAADRFEAFRGQLDAAGATVFRVYRFLSEQSPVPSDAVRLLHISDLHLNPVGYDLAKNVAGSFRVHAILDTGDTAAEGTTLERFFVESARDFSVPYVWVRGNHDSSAIEEAVAALPNGRALDGETFGVEDILIAGFGDPTFTPGISREITTEEQQMQKKEYAAEVLRLVRALPDPPDIVLVHDRLIAESLSGEVRLVLAGHGHRFETREREGTLFLTVGSTGGAGLESLAGDGDPNALQVLYFDRDSKRLIAIDRIEVRGTTLGFSLTRTLITPIVEQVTSHSTNDRSSRRLAGPLSVALPGPR